ncbi:MAG: DUF3426 domain-containing protein [Deltaproteobacteria bacterium]|jgi:hypothetical protein|nr:DUF3426 domain-containing protein [Deltaproteobacteria bacterium]
MIIKCPSCNSEFAIDDSVLKKAKSPRFHCNICNLFFRISKDDIFPSTYQDFESENKLTPQEIQKSTHIIKAKYKNIFHIRKTANKQIESLPPTATEPESEISSAEPSLTKKLSQVTQPVLPQDKVSSKSGVWIWDNTKKIASTKPYQKKLKKYIDDINFNLGEEGVFIDQIIAKQEENLIIKQTKEQLKKQFLNQLNRLKKTATSIYTLSSKVGAKIKANLKAIPPKIILFLFLPYAFFVTVCYGAKNIEQAPKIISVLMGINKDNLQEVAPSSLEILNLEQQEISTPGSERVVMVSGNIFNTDIYSFENIYLELKTYDKHNRTLASRVVPISETNNIKLKPNHSVDFKLSLTDAEQKVSYFSVRVYSVKRTMNNL